MSKDDLDRYFAAAHAMQSGVAMEMNYNPEATESKHLRVGVNSALVNAAALATLLMSKGIITADEYEKAIADAMEAERDRYAQELEKIFGRKVTLA